MRAFVRVTALLGAVTLVAAGAGAFPAAAAGSSTTGAAVALRQLTKIGTTNVRALAAHVSAGARSYSRHLNLPDKTPASKSTPIPVPNPSPTPIGTGKGGASGFVGLTDLAQVNAYPSGTQFSLEPPDQGLCAHGGYVLEPINNALQVYTESGKAALSPALGLSAFFGLPPEIEFGPSGNPTFFGPFISDPRCYYDAQTDRWFVTELEIAVDPSTGALLPSSAELVAVSQTNDPLGSWTTFSINSTEAGDANCPCFGDQPRIGADANGFYISDDIYPITGVFNSDGAELYAVSKQGLTAAADGTGPLPTLVAIHVGATKILNPADGKKYPANALQPAESPQGGGYASNTEYFMSTPDFNGFATMGGEGASSVLIWSLTGTNTLSNKKPAVKLAHANLASEPYTAPIAAVQKAGVIPYGTSLGATESELSVNDDRMQQVEYANGVLYSSLNTGIGSDPTNQAGVAWFAVTPTGGKKLGGTVSDGYVAVGGGATLLYPSIGLGTDGTGVMTFSLSGPSNFPSAAFMNFSGGRPSGSIYIVGAGAAPEDGFTCYAAAGFGPNCRWGDYTAATSDGAGKIVMGDEMIAQSPRNPDANWATFLSAVAVS
ncbi:MAG: hypothetical protein WB807_03905 [Candidatus Dormiibacterota bacterium]